MSDEMREILDSPIYLLGICDKFNEPIIATTASFPLARKDIIGLRDFYISQIFPFSAESFYLIFILDNSKIEKVRGKKLLVVHENGKEIGGIELTHIEIMGSETGLFSSRFTLAAVQVPGSCPIPGACHIYILEGEERKNLVGRFNLYHQPALPLIQERIQALKSNPTAAKYIKVMLDCKKCNDRIVTIAGIDKEGVKEHEVWYEDLPDFYICSCGNLNQDMRYLKGNLHGLLGYKPSPFSLNEQIEKNYTHAALETVAKNFWDLLEKENANEEELQKFIEKNSIILCIFSPELLRFKAPINAKFKTDFALLNQKHELVLIEIEKPNTKLFTKNGTQHSELTHAIGQVEDWLQRAKRNRLGLIDDLGIEGLKLDTVTNIKAVVIAGRSLKEYEPFIEKLRARSDIEFYTYDDLFKFLREIISKVREI